MDVPPFKEQAKFWTDPQLGNLELLWATYTTFAFTPHTHDTFAIGITEIGAQAFTYRRTQHFVMPAGSVAVVNPGEVHTSRAADESGWTYRMLYPAPALLQKAVSEIAGRQRDIPFFPDPVIQDSYLAQLIRNCHTSLEDNTTSLLERESRLLWALAQLVMRHADSRVFIRDNRPEHTSVRQAREFLEQNYAEPISLEQLASIANLSEFHLLRVFREQVGLPPHAYLTHIRIRVAKQLLLLGMPIVDVAAETGFVDQSHLSKQFKRVLGITPGQYQQNSKKVQYPFSSDI